MKRINDHTAHDQMKKAKKCYQEASADVETLIEEGLKNTTHHYDALKDADYWYQKLTLYKAQSYA